MTSNSLTNAMVVALGLGILVVATTLFLTRPSTEPFTEIYFNNHSSLPQFVTLNEMYPYSFSIQNHLGDNSAYEYTVSTEYFELDYSCETPELWINSFNDDPALYINEDNYSIGFDYEFKEGETLGISIGNDTLFITKEKLTFKGREINILSRQVITDREMPSMPSTNSANSDLHRIRVHVEKRMNITLDSRSYIFNDVFERGYLNIETFDTYAEFTNAYIAKGINYPVYIRLPATRYTAVDFKNDTGRYYAQDPINLSTYTVTAVFKLNSVSIQFTENTKIIADNQTLTVIQSNSTRTFQVSQKSTNSLTAKVKNDSMVLYYNDEYVTDLEKEDTIIPEILYENATIKEFSVKSDEEPLTINYNIPKTEISSQVITVDNLRYLMQEENYTPTFTNITQGLNDTQQISELLEQERISSDNYRISMEYMDMDGVLYIGLATLDENIYTITLNGSKMNVEYHNPQTTLQQKEINTSTLRWNTLQIDYFNGTLSIFHNDKRIFNERAIASGGILLLDYDNIKISNAYLEDRNTGMTTLYRKTEPGCPPILLSSDVYNGTAFVPADGIVTINNTVRFDRIFDIAKVEIALKHSGDDKSQKIYYWVQLK